MAQPVQAVEKSFVPSTYSANPEPFFVGVWDQIPKGSGKYLPDVFGWERGPDYFSKWNTVPVQLRANKVRWRTDGQNMRNGFNSASGADPNKYTDKLSYPGSYQGWGEGTKQKIIIVPDTRNKVIFISTQKVHWQLSQKRLFHAALFPKCFVREIR